jgi:hypothetical protein
MENNVRRPSDKATEKGKMDPVFTISARKAMKTAMRMRVHPPSDNSSAVE